MGYEFIHDTIAKQVYAKASTEARTRRKIEKFIADRHQAYLERGASISQEDLDYILPYRNQISISDEEKAFVKKSQRDLRRAARNKRRIIIGIIGLLMLFSIFSFAQWQNAQRQKIKADEKSVLAEEQRELAEIAKDEAERQENIATQKSDSLDLASDALSKSLDSLSNKERALQQSLAALRSSENALNISFDSLAAKEQELELSLAQTQEAKDSAIAAQNRAVINAEVARLARDEAVQKSIEAQANALAANARSVYQKDNTLALNLAFAAYRTHPGPEALEILEEVLSDNNQNYYQDAHYHGNPVTAIALSPDGKQLLSGGAGGKVLLWDLEKGTEQELERSHRRPITDLTFAPGGDFFLGVSEDSTATLWSTSGKQLQELGQPYRKGVFREGTIYSQYTARLTAAAISPSGQSILLGNDQGFIYLYKKTENDTIEYKVDRVYFMERKLKGRKKKSKFAIGGFTEMEIRFTTENQFIAYSGRGSAMSYDLEGNLLKKSMDVSDKEFQLSEYVSLDLRPRDPFFLTANSSFGVSRIGPDPRDIQRLVTEPVKRMARIDDDRFLTVFPDGNATIWNMRGDTLLRFFKLGTINDLQVHPDGQSFFTADADGLIKQWNIASQRGRGIFLRRSFEETPRYYAFSGTSHNLIINGKEYTSAGNLVRELPFLPSQIDKLITSPHAPGLLLGLQGKEATLWNEEGKVLNTLRHNWPITDADFSPDGRQMPFRHAVRKLYLEHFRPIYLIFDQFEELYILGSKAEQQQFHRTVSDLLQAGLQCKLLLIIREEYLAYLTEFEKSVPSLFDNRLRIEKMSDRNLARVVTGTCRYGHIRLEEPRKVVPAILANLRSKREGVDLSNLQVYLDRLWRKDIERQEEQGKSVEEVVFDMPLIQSVGKMENVLSDFLDEQLAGVEEGLRKRGVQQADGLPLEVLFTLVTEDATKRNMELESIPQALPRNRKLSTEDVAYCLERFQDIRLLRHFKKEE